MAADELIEIDLAGDDEYDLDAFLQGLGDATSDDLAFVAAAPEELDSWLAVEESGYPEPVSTGGSPAASEKSGSGSPGSDLSEIEKFLFDEDFDATGGGFDCHIFSDLFPDGLDGAAVSAPPVEAEEKAEEVREASAGAEDDGDDPISKKRRRQMRNRDSALKSRERKKMYVGDLEKKSKYLESECRRLDYALRCCMAENVALRQRLLNERPIGARGAKQESAVLVVESLLLGSLFWLMSIVCLFLLPGLPILKRKYVSGLGGDPAQEVVWAKKGANESFGSGFRSVIMRRRCRSMRTKMKAMLFLRDFVASLSEAHASEICRVYKMSSSVL